MLTYIIRRLLISIVLLFIISLISFAITILTPGRPTPWGEMNPNVSETVKHDYYVKFHLDQPIYKQYWFLMSDLFRNKLVSNRDSRPVLDTIFERLPVTLLLNVTALTMTFVFGIFLGVYSVRHAGRWPDTATTLLAFLFIALPGFWISYLTVIFLVKFAAVPLLGLSTTGVHYANWMQYFLDHFWHLLPPAMILALGGIAIQSRYVRASMQDALIEDYIRTARAKGLTDEVVLYKHALRNSLRPLITGLGMTLPALLGGSVIIESIFAISGMGRLGFDSVMARDYPTLVALNFVAAALLLLGNLIADILYAVVDPRVRLK